MFSFGLFSSLAPFLLMLLVSAFGVISHFAHKKHHADNELPGEQKIECEIVEAFADDLPNPFSEDSTDVPASDKCTQAALHGKILHRIFAFRIPPGIDQIIPRDTFPAKLFSRPPPVSLVIA